MKYYNVAEDRISVIYLGVDNRICDCRVIRETSMHERRPFVLYVGERAGYKNFTKFVQGFSLSDTLMSDFDIVAFGGGHFTSKEYCLFASLGINKDQIYQVSGSDDLLSEYFRSASAFIYPSLYEGFGLPPLEAMSNGCPVVASNTSSIPEVIGPAAKYFDPNNVEDICDAMEQVLFKSDVSKYLVEEGFNRVKSFNWVKCAEATVDVYKMLTQ